MKNLLTAALAALLCSCGGANYTITGRYELPPGDSVYLLSERGPFTCGTPCELTLRFDDDPARTVGGEIPSTGEHAIFVEDFAYFATHLADADLVSIDVTLEDGGAQTVEFEVGGYDPGTIGAP